MQPIGAALAAQHHELDELLGGLDATAWARLTPCDGWTVADVVLHLAQTDEMATASVEGRFDQFLAEMTAGVPSVSDVDQGAAAMVDRERGASDAAVYDRWRTSARTLRESFGRVDPRARVTWVAGQLSAQTLATTRLAECWIHTGDVAVATGVDQRPSERLWHVARLAWRTLPYAFVRAGEEMQGAVAFELRAPNGEVWRFDPSDPPLTTVRGSAIDLCNVAVRRVAPSDTDLVAVGADGDRVLELVRTYA